MKHPLLILYTAFCLALVSTLAKADCKFTHPHHCIQSAGEKIFGGVKKRAKMIIDDPLGTSLNPIKVIDEGIPTPVSFVEYVVKNPDETIAILKNPTAGVVGMPLAVFIADSRNAALKNGTRPIPHDIKPYMAPLFSEEFLDSVRYSTDSDLWDGLAQFIALHTTAGAVTLVNVIVFKDETGANSPDNIRLWAHELFHVQQYSDMGLLPFAATLTLSPGMNGSIERPAYNFDRDFERLYNDRTGSRFSGIRTVSADLMVGLGGKCMAATRTTRQSSVVLDYCSPTLDLQQWRLTFSGELRTSNNLCLDIRGGRPDNRTPLQIFECNGTKAQRFEFTKHGELKTPLRQNLCVEVAGGNTVDGTPIQTFDCNRTASQFWRKPLTTLIAAAQPLGANARCLRVDLPIRRSLIRLAECNKQDRWQHWAIDRNTGALRLINFPEMCLDVRGGRPDNRTPLQLFECNGTRAQRFTFTKSFQLQSHVGPGRCVDVPGSNIMGNEPIQSFECNGTLAQLWNPM
jgi:hypothetical protein